MNNTQSFRIGGIPLDPSRINKPFLKKMLDATEKAELKDGKSTAKAAVKELYEKGEVSTEKLESLESFAKAMRKEWKEDKDTIWANQQKIEESFDAELAADIEARKQDQDLNAPFLGAERVLKDTLREATALAAVQALAGADFGPTAAVAGYAAYVNGTKWDGPAERSTAKLVETYQQYLSGDSPMTTTGNSVQQVHREELWKTLTGMTREAAESGKNGKPVSITAQYYELTSPELVGNLAEAAKAGSKLRLNMDVGRLSYPAKDPITEVQYYEVDDMATKMRTVLQFAELKDADVGVSIFPAKSQLGSPTDLMHRKVLQVGEKVLMSGMNGNVGSGENVDAGYVIEGPAARRFTENAARDISNSAGAQFDDIWGEKQKEKFDKSDLRMGTTGLVALFDLITGPSPAGTALPRPHSLEELEGLAKKAGVELKSVVQTEEGAYESTMASVLNQEEGVVSLSDQGKKLLMKQLDRGVAATNRKDNLEALNDVSLPSGKEVGKTTVDIADQPEEREVLTINAIQQAEEFIYVPGFVVTRAVSGAIVARYKEAQEKGQDLDIRVIADPGIYPFGGTPNSWGVNFLEEHGIPVRWAKLTRSGSHDRKVHAKQVLTDKGEIAGSTNFSEKGMRENWETSAYVRFDKDDKEAQALKEQSKAQFEKLWEEDAYPLSTQDLAAYYSKNRPEEGREFFTYDAKAGATRQIITSIENFEVESGTLVQQLNQREDVAARRQELIDAGYSDGDAMLMAVDQVIGEKKFDKMKDELPTSLELSRLHEQVSKWKNSF